MMTRRVDRQIGSSDTEVQPEPLHSLRAQIDSYAWHQNVSPRTLEAVTGAGKHANGRWSAHHWPLPRLEGMGEFWCEGCSEDIDDVDRPDVVRLQRFNPYPAFGTETLMEWLGDAPQYFHKSHAPELGQEWRIPED
jgi:hypothetical protein